MLFERSGKDKDAEVAQEKQDELFKQIGQLQVENAFLKVPAGVRERTDLVEPENKELTIVRQCELLGISRSTYYYTSVKSYDEWELAVLKAIIEELTPPPSMDIGGWHMH